MTGHGPKQMAISDLFAIAFWPVVIGAGLVTWIPRAHKRLAAIRAIAGVVVLGFGLVGVIALIAFDIASLWVLLDFFVGAIVFGGSCLGYVYMRWAEISVWSRTWMGAFGAAMLVYGTWCLVADYLMPRRVVEGTVKHLHLSSGRGPEEGNVTIDGRDYKATMRLYRTLRVGDRHRIEVGQGSKYIYRIDGRPAP